MPLARIITVDVARGLAIFIMVPANMATSVYLVPHAFSFRVVSSFAAPLFIIVAGMMIVLAANAKINGWQHYLMRGTLLVAMGTLVDVLIFKLIPFYSYDVLYLIGIACPLTYFFARLPRTGQLLLIIFIFLITPFLQWQFGYTDHPGEYYLWGGEAGTQEVRPEHPTSMLAHLLIDGWFPIFPWLGMSFAGATIAQTFFMPEREFAGRAMVLAAIALLIVGIAAWLAYPGQEYDRDGYTELFYPPTLGFIVTACGVVLALLWAIHWSSSSPLYAPLRWFGECSLFMYILHLAIIAYVLEPLFPNKPLPTFLMINFATLFVLAAIARAVRQLKIAWPDRPYAMRFLLGG